MQEAVADQGRPLQQGMLRRQDQKRLQLLPPHRTVAADLIVEAGDPLAVVGAEQDQVAAGVIGGKPA